MFRYLIMLITRKLLFYFRVEFICLHSIQLQDFVILLLDQDIPGCQISSPCIKLNILNSLKPHAISFPFQDLNIFCSPNLNTCGIVQPSSKNRHQNQPATLIESHLCTEVVLHLCFHFIDILRSNDLFFMPHHLWGLCLSIAPGILTAVRVNLRSCWQNLHVMFQYVLKWPSDPSMIIQVFFPLQTKACKRVVSYPDDNWAVACYRSLQHFEAFRLVRSCAISDSLAGKCLGKKLSAVFSFLYIRCKQWF